MICIALRLDDVIGCAANGSVVIRIAAGCLRQNDYLVCILVQVQCADACCSLHIQIAVLRDVISHSEFRCSITLRHFIQTQLITCQIALAADLHKCGQIVETIVSVTGYCCSRCSGCYWCTSCDRRCRCDWCTRCHRCTVCHKCKTIVRFPLLVSVVVILPGQLDGCRCDTHFVRILDAVVIGIVPDVAVNGCVFDLRQTAVMRCDGFRQIRRRICYIADGDSMFRHAFCCLSCQNNM